LEGYAREVHPTKFASCRASKAKLHRKQGEQREHRDNDVLLDS